MFVAYFLSLFLSLNASGSTWEVNDDHSEILFQVPYLSVAEVTGRLVSLRAF